MDADKAALTVVSYSAKNVSLMGPPSVGVINCQARNSQVRVRCRNTDCDPYRMLNIEEMSAQVIAIEETINSRMRKILAPSDAK